MGTVREWEIRDIVTAMTPGDCFGGWLWLSYEGGQWSQCCYASRQVDGACQFASVPRLDKEIIADLAWVCYQIEGGKKKGRLR